MMQQLFIDGNLADIEQDVSVGLSLKSNLLGDISRIASNHTYTFALPATGRNKRLIGFADTLAVQTTFPYQYHRADYYRDGVPVIQGGRLVLLSVAERIECVVTWGVTSALSALVQSGATLRDLNGSETIEYTEVPTRMTWGDFLADTTYAPLYANGSFAAPLDDAEQQAKATARGWNATYIRPVVRVPWLLNKIQSQYGVTLSFGQDEWDVIRRLVIPLVDDSPAALPATSSVMTLAEPTSSGSVWLFPFSMDNTGSIFSSYTSDAAYVSTPKTITLFVNFTMTMPLVWASVLATSNHLQVRVTDGTNTEEPDDLQLTFSVVESNGEECVVQAKGEIDVTLAAGQGIQLLLVSDSILWHNPNVVAPFVGKTISAANKSDHIQFGSPYPITSNLPEIKIVDFVKTLCALLGVWCKQPKGNELEFVPYGILADNEANALDWTSIVIPSYYEERPQKTEYRVSEWARKNWLRYKENDGYNGEDDASLNIADDTLDVERELITLPFAASKTNSLGQANVPVWKLSNYEQLMVGEETTPVYSIEKPEPRILMARPTKTRRYIGGGGNSDDAKAVQLSMDGMSFNEILTARYGALARHLASARLITERVRMSDVELLSFDETRPVWLGQYGQTFAVLEINASADGTADVKLLKL